MVIVGLLALVTGAVAKVSTHTTSSLKQRREAARIRAERDQLLEGVPAEIVEILQKDMKENHHDVMRLSERDRATICQMPGGEDLLTFLELKQRMAEVGL